MDKNLKPYQDQVRVAEAMLRTMLASGDESVTEVAVARQVLELLTEQITRWPFAVMGEYDRAPPDPETGRRGAKLWWLNAYRHVRRELLLEGASDGSVRLYRQKQKEYYDLAITIVQFPFRAAKRVEDTTTGMVYLVRPNTALVKRAMPVIAAELMRWFNRHPLSHEFLAKSVEQGWREFLTERPHINVILRLIDHLPLDVESYFDESIIVKPSLVQLLIETAISLIPVVGEVVALAEFYSGYDLFGNPLSELDRGILAATLVLPVAGVLTKGGRAVYTETRLVRLYGRTVDDWQRAISAAGRIDEHTLRTLVRAEEALRTQGRLGPALAREAAAALPNVARPARLLQTAIDREVSEVFRELGRRYPILATLDEYAILRVLEKGPNPDHLKGQLLEELIESRLVPWLLDRNGRAALGSPLVGEPLVFIPGHMIRDADGRQITDGMLGVWHQGELVIGGIFEAKAGRRAARELSFARGSISSLTQAQRDELRAMATDIFRVQQARAKQACRPFRKTIEDVEKEVALSERGGQVRRDIERLDEDSFGIPARIYIGDIPHPVAVRISPTRTRFFGVLPKDVNPSLIGKELADTKVSFEIIGVDMSQRELRAVADQLAPLAERMFAAPPSPNP